MPGAGSSRCRISTANDGSTAASLRSNSTWRCRSHAMLNTMSSPRLSERSNSRNRSTSGVRPRYQPATPTTDPPPRCRVVPVPPTRCSSRVGLPRVDKGQCAEPPEAIIESWLAVSVTMWLCAESVEDVYDVSAGCNWSAAGMFAECVCPLTFVDVLKTSATADGLVVELPQPIR